MERLLNMILRRLMNKGINAGIKAVSNRGKRDQDESPEERQMNKQAQQNLRGVRQTSRMLGRINKF